MPSISIYLHSVADENCFKSLAWRMSKVTAGNHFEIFHFWFDKLHPVYLSGKYVSAIYSERHISDGAQSHVSRAKLNFQCPRSNLSHSARLYKYLQRISSFIHSMWSVEVSTSHERWDICPSRVMFVFILFQVYLFTDTRYTRGKQVVYKTSSEHVMDDSTNKYQTPK